MSKELISVIVPVYNVEKYMERCIDSIIAQTLKNIEIILVDDGSTDSSGSICDRYAEFDDRIKVIHKENGGLSDARNAGMAIASGKWYSFIDSDDYITENFLEDLYTAAIDNNCRIAVCNMVRIYEDGETEKFYAPTNSLELLKNDKRYETLKQPSVCNKLFKSDLFDNVIFPKGKYYEDTFVYHILIHRANSAILTGNSGYFYYSRRDSILGQAKYTERYFDFVEAVYKRVTYLLEHNVDQYAQEACLSLYAAVAAAEKNIEKNIQNKDKFTLMHGWYDIAYKHLMKHPSTGIKQKIRLVMLKYIPFIHNAIY